MATTATKAAKSATRSRSHKKTIAPGAGSVDVNAQQRSQQERRLLNWVYGNAEMIQTALAREATYLGDNHQIIDMNRCLANAAEFGKLAGIGDTSGVPAHFPRQQQRSETQSSQVPLVQAASA